MERDARAAVAFLFLTLVWGTTWAGIRISLEGIPPLTGVAIRFTIAGLLLLGWARARGVRLGGRRYERALWIANGLLSFVFSYGVIYWAEQRVPSGLAAVLFATFPLWVALLARRLVPDERTSWMRLACIGIGFAGVAVLFSEDLDATLGPGALVAGVAILVAALASALASVLLKRYGSGIPPISLAAPPMLLAGAVLAPFALAAEHARPLTTQPGPWLATLYLALVGSAATFPVYFWLLSHRSVVSAALVSYTAPVIAVLVGILGLREPFTPRLAVGAGLVLIGVAGALQGRARRG